VALLPDEQTESSEWNTLAGRNTPGYQTPSNLRGNDTSLTQTVTQKATNLGVSAGTIKPNVPPKQTTEDTGKPDVPPKQTTEDVGAGYPETLTSGEIAGARQAVGNIKPVAFDIKQAHDVSMPSTETQGQQPGEHTSGIGSLPGSKDEQGVAVLPEERATKTTETARPENRDQPGDLPDQTKKLAGASGVGVSGATDSLKKDTQSRRLPTETPAPEPKTASPEPDEAENLSSVQRSGGSEGSADGQQRKASFKEKISGGMKVVSGKLGHDKSKVEEGRKLMHGQSA